MTGKLCTAICHVISPAIEPEKVIHNTITNNMHKIVEKIQCENLVIVVLCQMSTDVDDVHFVLDQHADLCLYSASSQKQQM